MNGLMDVDKLVQTCGGTKPGNWIPPIPLLIYRPSDLACCVD